MIVVELPVGVGVEVVEADPARPERTDTGWVAAHENAFQG